MPNLWQVSARPARVGEHLAVLFARIGLAGDGEALFEVDAAREELVQFPYFGVVTVEESEEARLGSGRSLDAPAAEG